MTKRYKSVDTSSLKLERIHLIQESKGVLVSLIWLILCTYLSLFLSGKAAKYVNEGLTLCISKVVPSIFPFLIISDLYSAYGHPERIKPLAFLFNKLFGIERSGAGAYLTGILCGFPLGAKAAARLYGNGVISKENAERLIAFSSQPSPAFIISAVGIGMLGSFRLGLLLWCFVILSSLLCGLLLRGRTNSPVDLQDGASNTVSLVDVIRSAGLSTLTVCSFITVFSVICGLIKELLPIEIATPFLAFLEVTSAVNHFSALPHEGLRLICVAFCLGFGGLSVMLQSAGITEGSGLSLKTYIPLKLLQGILCSALASLYFIF